MATRPARDVNPAEVARLDRLLHEPARLAIVSVLAPRRDVAFTELRELAELTDGNLSVHLRTLQDAGYVRVDKDFVGSRPRTTVRLARKGRAAFHRYLDSLEALLKAARAGAGDGPSRTKET